MPSNFPSDTQFAEKSPHNTDVLCDLSLSSLWTGSRLLSFTGGPEGIRGGQYDPASDTWTSLNTNKAPQWDSFGGRWIWNGTELMMFSTGAEGVAATRYNPSTDVWTSIPTNGLPRMDGSPYAVWTGTEVLLIQGTGVSSIVGERYKPDTDSWAPINRYAPSISSHPSEAQVIWTGTEMLLGFTRRFSSGVAAGSYNPSSDRWSLVQGNGFVTSDSDGLQAPITVWTGKQVLLFAGSVAAPNARGFVFTYTPLPPLYLYQRQ